MVQGGHRFESRNIRHHPQQDRAAQGGHAVAEEARGPQEPQYTAGRPVGTASPSLPRWLAALTGLLQLTDTCVKNGGSHFLVEIASREFMDNLVSLLRAPGAINAEVRGKMLEMIQNWSSAFDGNANLSYVGEVYKNLKAEGFDFPPPIKVSSTFVDSSAVSSPLLTFGIWANFLSHRIGPTPMSACAVAPLFPLPIESITAETAEASFAVLAPRNRCLFPVLE